MIQINIVKYTIHSLEAAGSLVAMQTAACVKGKKDRGSSKLCLEQTVVRKL